MQKHSMIFFGSPDFAASFLEKLMNDTDLAVEVKVVVTQPDRPIGTKQILSPTPVKIMAKKYNLQVFDGPIRLLPQFLSEQGEKIDLALLYAYGKIIPASLIESFPAGFWNIHPSMLPLYRNVAPMAYPLMLGDTKTGVTLIQLDDKLDHGPILAQKELAIEPDDMRVDLERKLSELAYELFKKLFLDSTTSGNKAVETAQDHSKATYTRMMKKEDGFIPLSVLTKSLANESLSASEFPQILREYYEKYPQTKKTKSSSLLLYKLFRGLSPWPGIWTKMLIDGQEKRLKITDIKFTNGKLSLEKVQLEGKSETEFKVFNRVHHVS